MNFLSNIQFQQFFNLTLLVLLGYLNNRLQTNLLNILLITLYSGAIELILKKRLFIPYSAFITALGVVLMVGWLKWYIPYIIIFLALLQKHFIKIDNNHIFNPSNFALILAIVLFYPKALPIVGEIGKELYIANIVIFIGTIILIRVNRLAITLSFLISYILFNYLFIGNSDPMWNLDYFISKLYSISFIVFIFFMLTDPKTTPSSIKLQIFFGILIALLTTLFNLFLGIRVWNQFLALFISSLIFIPIYRNLKSSDYKKIILLSIIVFSFVTYISLQKPLYFSM